METLIQYLQKTQLHCKYLVSAYKYKTDGSYNYLEDSPFENSILDWMQMYNGLKREKETILLKAPIEKFPILLKALRNLNEKIDDEYSKIDLSKLHPKLEFKYTRFKKRSQELNSFFIQELGDDTSISQDSVNEDVEIKHPNIFPSSEDEKLFFYLSTEYINENLRAKYSWIYHFMNRGSRKKRIFDNMSAYCRFIESSLEISMSKVQTQTQNYKTNEKLKLHNMEHAFNQRLTEK